MPSSNFSTLHRTAEATPGVTPASARFTRAYVTSQSLAPTDSFVRDETITGDRLVREHFKVSVGAGGAAAFNWIWGAPDWGLELALMNRFTPMLEAYNLTADSKITNIVSATHTMTAEGAWKPGMLVRTSGNTAATNDKLFRAAAGSTTDTLVGPSGTFGADDSAPAAGARAICLGLEGAEGDLAFVADGVTSSALDFTTLPITVGAACKISGSAVAGNNVFATIAAVAANKLTLTDLPAALTVDDGSGDTVRVWIGDVAEHGGDTLLTDTFEWTNPRMTTQAYLTTVGVAATDLSMAFAQNAPVTGSINLQGFSHLAAGASVAGSKSDPLHGVGQLMRSGAQIARLTEAGAATAIGSCTQDLNFTLRTGIAPIGCLTSDSPVDYSLGDAELVLAANYRFGDKTIFEKLANETPSAHFIVFARSGQAYAMRCVYGVYTGGNVTDRGKGQEVLAAMTFEGAKDPTTGKTFVATRFREYA